MLYKYAVMFFLIIINDFKIDQKMCFEFKAEDVFSTQYESVPINEKTFYKLFQEIEKKRLVIKNNLTIFVMTDYRGGRLENKKLTVQRCNLLKDFFLNRLSSHWNCECVPQGEVQLKTIKRIELLNEEAVESGVLLDSTFINSYTEPNREILLSNANRVQIEIEY